MLTVGYWQGSAALARLDGLRYATEAPDADDATRDPATDSELERADLIPAETLDRGDPRFARAGARVRLHGMFPVEDRPAGDLASLSLDVSFEPFHDAMFHAWGFENAALPCARPGTAFTVPIDGASGLTLIFDIAGTGERIDYCAPSTREVGGGRFVRRLTVCPSHYHPHRRPSIVALASRAAEYLASSPELFNNPNPLREERSAQQAV